ncbi:Retrovirus-related Pol poly from transposon [Octopus vulgaris]|uniref:Retrovirus-related Pol poly from transposon n=1 Tax=Octopus vulgaris TaxID=6645 RepID=A0AA36F0Q7_OCTVU|nr:Retrovirus-related Pol poly from transposon [Octopus vulgaris]
MVKILNIFFKLLKTVGLFVYYSKWIPKFSDKIKLLVETKYFPLSEEAMSSLKTLRDDSANTTLKVIDKSLPFSIETGALEVAISGILHQNGKFRAVFHSDNAKCFVPKELKQFLYDRGIAITHSTVYNSRGNVQCERYNGAIWNSIKLTLRSRNLPVSQ